MDRVVRGTVRLDDDLMVRIAGMLMDSGLHGGSLRALTALDEVFLNLFHTTYCEEKQYDYCFEQSDVRICQCELVQYGISYRGAGVFLRTLGHIFGEEIVDLINWA